MLWEDLVKATCLMKIAVKLGMGKKIVTYNRNIGKNYKN